MTLTIFTARVSLSATRSTLAHLFIIVIISEAKNYWQ